MPNHRGLLAALALFVTAGCAVLRQPAPPPPAPTATTTPSPAPTETPTPSPTLTPTAAPTATPQPLEGLVKADKALWLGDQDLALQDYQALVSDESDPDVLAAALLGIGRIKLNTSDYPAAIDTLQKLIKEHPESPQTPAAYLYLAKTYDALERYSDAASAYESYLKLRPGVIDAYVQEQRGDSLAAAGEHTGAAGAYQAASQADHLGGDARLDMKIGQQYLLAGEYSTALGFFNQVYTTAEDDPSRADAEMYAGQSYLDMGDPSNAHERLMDAVVNFPKTAGAYNALVLMVNNGLEVSDLLRGTVDYYAGQYEAAYTALDRYIKSGVQQDGSALYFLGLTQAAMENYTGAIGTLDRLIQNYPQAEHYADAWDEKATILWSDLDKMEQGAQALLDFVAANPTDGHAPAFLFDAARILERNNNLEAAANTWQRASDEYPANSQAFQGMFLAGISRYRLGNFTDSETTFRRAVLIATAPEDQAAATLWAGKALQATGDRSGAEIAWQRAAALDPAGYYSERAAELLSGRTPFSAGSTPDLGYDLNAEKLRAASWLINQFDLPANIDLTASLGELASDPRWIRGREFWSLGFYEQASAEFEDLRQAYSKDPVATFRLAGWFYDLGLYRSAILASRQVLDLAHLEYADTLNAPAYFNHIRFGPYYKDLVLPETRDKEIDPLFVLSLMRQESLFEGFISSQAGARGLMQIMPATGQGIASEIRWPYGYSPDDLYRPIVSTRLGVYYLAQQRDYFDGDMYAALAAYNAGPGNASIWKDLAGNDPDLLLEVIRIQETRTYIKNIYEMYTVYRRLYGGGSG